eukprot:Sspe_Gene.42581::Locus_20688_Transcript_1_1_Confidence_1.000_Length_3018::g.42581::m.42581
MHRTLLLPRLLRQRRWSSKIPRNADEVSYILTKPTETYPIPDGIRPIQSEAPNPWPISIKDVPLESYPGPMFQKNAELIAYVKPPEYMCNPSRVIPLGALGAILEAHCSFCASAMMRLKTKTSSLWLPVTRNIQVANGRPVAHGQIYIRGFAQHVNHLAGQVTVMGEVVDISNKESPVTAVRFIGNFAVHPTGGLKRETAGYYSFDRGSPHVSSSSSSSSSR